MTVLDDKFVPKALAMVAEFGKTVTFTVKSLTPYNPLTGGVGEGIPITHSVKVSPPDQYDKRLVDGDIVKQADLKVLLPPTTLFTPAVDSTFVDIDGSEFRVIGVKPVYSGELIAIFELQLRQ